jgi:alanine racemase
MGQFKMCAIGIVTDNVGCEPLLIAANASVRRKQDRAMGATAPSSDPERRRPTHNSLKKASRRRAAVSEEPGLPPSPTPRKTLNPPSSFRQMKTMPLSNPRLEVDLSSLCANYRLIKAEARGAAVAAVVKCDGYGLGAAAVARTLSLKENCAIFFVAYSEEGAAVRAALGDRAAEIYVFNGPFAEFLPLYRDHRLKPVLNTPEQIALWAEAMPGAPAALHVDTGINRLGLGPAELSAAPDLRGITVELLISHLACSSDPQDAMNNRQLDAFEEIARRFPSARKSLASTAGAFFGADYGFDLIRAGVALYGSSPFERPIEGHRPVARLVAPIIETRTIEAGESVGYGATFTARRRTRIATASIGYGDGYPRGASNKARAFVGGAPCPIAGRVSMDLIVLDVTDAPSAVATGDEAEFFGPAISIDAVAAAAGGVGYEILTQVGGLARPRTGGLGGRVERRYLYEGKPADQSLTGAGMNS